MWDFCHQSVSIRHHYLHFCDPFWNWWSNLFAEIMFVRSSTKTSTWSGKSTWHYELFLFSEWCQLKKIYYYQTKSEKIYRYVGTNILCQLKNMSAMHNSYVWLAEIEKKNLLPMIWKLDINDVCEFLSKDA